MATYKRAQVEVKDIDEALVITSGRNMYRQDYRVPVRVIVDNGPVFSLVIRSLTTMAMKRDYKLTLTEIRSVKELVAFYRFYRKG